MEEDIRERVKRVLIGRLRGESDLDYDTPLIEFGIGADSISLLELLVALEEEFKIRIDESKVKRGDLDSINSIATFIERECLRAG
ncbi:MAG: phosphopantetheine-binding protein [Candidatus Caldarchaeum sp.]